jgi:glycosyltransferase involved in cell wall biosynthesis
MGRKTARKTFADEDRTGVTSNEQKTAPQVSVIVPFYNSEKYIERCIESLIGQNYPSACYEVVLVDNNSTDRSAAIAANYPPIQILKETKQGSYAARNRAVAASRGDILAFTDSDCVASSDWLRELTAPFRDPGVGLVQGRRTFGEPGSTLSMVSAFECENHAYIFSGAFDGAIYGFTNNMAVRREVFDRCGPFVETARGADSIFVDRVVAAASHRVLRYSREASVRHLELTSVRQWLGKKIIYGRSARQNGRHISPYRPRTPEEKAAIFARTIQLTGCSAAQARWLRGVIWVSRLSFRYGRLTAGGPVHDK